MSKLKQKQIKKGNNMELYITEIEALDPESGKMKSWAGPAVHSLSFKKAQQHFNENGKGYCKVIGIRK